MLCLQTLTRKFSDVLTFLDLRFLVLVLFLCIHSEQDLTALKVWHYVQFAYLCLHDFYDVLLQIANAIRQQKMPFCFTGF